MNRDYIRKFCAEFDYPEEAIEAFYNAADFVESEETLCGMFEEFLDDYNTDRVPDPTRHYERLTAYSRTLDYPYETLDLLFFILMAEHLETVYERAGLPREMWHGAMDDLRCKLFECYNCKGIWGTFVGGWFSEFYCLNRVALGRLQYQISRFEKDMTTLDGKYSVKKGEAYIDMHIPSSGKLKIEDVNASLNRAIEYFGHLFDGDTVTFGCESWMLFDKHREWLPEESGIVQFMNLFSYAEVFPINPSNDLWRIFNTFETSSADRHKLPEDTLLRRKYKEYLTAGNKQGCAFGIFKTNKIH